MKVTDNKFKRMRMVIAAEAVLCLIAMGGILCKIRDGGGWDALYSSAYAI